VHRAGGGYRLRGGQVVVDGRRITRQPERRGAGGQRPRNLTRETEVSQEALHDGRVLDEGDQPEPPTAPRTGQDIEAALQPRPIASPDQHAGVQIEATPPRMTRPPLAGY
jgi:hypothetical protein